MLLLPYSGMRDEKSRDNVWGCRGGPSECVTLLILNVCVYGWMGGVEGVCPSESVTLLILNGSGSVLCL